MHRAWCALMVLLSPPAWGQTPVYAAAGIVHAADFSAGPFAPNDVVTLFGANLCGSNGATATEQPGVQLPATLAGVSVSVLNMPAPLLFVSPAQINFLLPANLVPGTVPVRVVNQGVTGPEVQIPIVAAAPSLFPNGSQYVLAVDWNNGNALITPDVPAHSGDVIILYATGLGGAGTIVTGEVPAQGAAIANITALKIFLGGTTVSSGLIQYAGLTPGWAGLYQINLVLPPNLGTDPELSVSIGDQSTAAALKLAIR
jgi:uncharacterized protein (TIGR03437 family)